MASRCSARATLCRSTWQSLPPRCALRECQSPTSVAPKCAPMPPMPRAVRQASNSQLAVMRAVYDLLSAGAQGGHGPWHWSWSCAADVGRQGRRVPRLARWVKHSGALSVLHCFSWLPQLPANPNVQVRALMPPSRLAAGSRRRWQATSQPSSGTAR